MGLGGSGQGVGGGTGLHAFDTRQLRPMRTLVRQHVIAQLGPLLKATGGYLNRIKALPRPLRNLTEEDLELIVRELSGQAPAILVALGKKTTDTIGTEATETRGDVEICVYAISSHARSFVEGRLEQDVVATSSATADPGIETILEHVEELLLGQELDLRGVNELRQTIEDEVASSPNHTMWEQVYTAKITRDINAQRLITTVLTNVRVKGALDGADANNPITVTVTNLEVPSP